MANCRIRFMTNNLLTTTNSAFSSENAVYPFSNALDTNRTRLWIPSGHFLIDSTNDKIYINDGANKTITLASGVYATPDLLKTEIYNKLNASSVGWLMAYNGSYGDFRFDIGRSAIHGPATIRLSQQTAAVWNTIGYVGTSDIIVPVLPGSARADEQRNHTSEYVTMDLGVQTECRFIGLIGPIDEIFGVSETATVTVKAANVNDFSSAPLSLTIPYHEDGMLLFVDDATNATYRYWKIEIIDQENPAGPSGIRIGHIYVGGFETITSSNIARGFRKETVDPSVEMKSVSGKRYYDTRQKFQTFDGLVIQNATEADRKIIEQIGFDYGVSEPLFVSLDPLENVSAELPEFTKLMRFASLPKSTHQILGYFTISFSMDEVI